MRLVFMRSDLENSEYWKDLEQKQENIIYLELLKGGLPLTWIRYRRREFARISLNLEPALKQENISNCMVQENIVSSNQTIIVSEHCRS